MHSPVRMKQKNCKQNYNQCFQTCKKGIIIKMAVLSLLQLIQEKTATTTISCIEERKHKSMTKDRTRFSFDLSI
jgi:hypothetical protein